VKKTQQRAKFLFDDGKVINEEKMKLVMGPRRVVPKMRKTKLNARGISRKMRGLLTPTKGLIDLRGL